jgi:hypothetical protein
MCFNTWNIFSKILCDTETPTLDLLRYRQTIVQPKSALPVYASVVTSPTYDFITSLSITVDIPVPQLVRLTSIANLGVLEISKGKDTLRYDGQVQLAQGVSDRIIRAWQLAASTHGAFRVLRILRLWGHDEVTVNSLELVSMFPGLAVYDVGGCNFASAESQVQARNHGWAIAPTVKILELLDEMCKQRAIWMQDHVSKVKSTHRPRSRPLWDEAIVNWVPRAKVPECFHQTKSEEPPERTLKIKPSKRKHAEKVDVNNMLAALDRPREHRNISSRRLEQAQASMAKVAETKPPKTWDFEAYAAFARIGELRGDSDLARAGVIIGDQAVVGDQLVNSVRMASLHLGPTNFLSSANSKGPIFTRWEAPAPSDLALMRASLIAREAPSVAKKPQPSVMKSKKRKLDDVLGSFF